MDFQAKFAASLATVALASVAFATPVGAQQSNIVVEGEKTSEPEAVRELVKRLASSHRPDEPATRYFDALCVSVSGLNSVGNDYVRNRIYENALKVGVSNGGDDCLANAMVLIHDDPEALVERIINDVPELLPSENRDPVREQLEAGSKVIVWHNERDYGQGGRPGVVNSAIPGDDSVGGQMNVQAQINVNSWPSRTLLAYSRAVVSAAIILDGEIVEGMEIDRLADYAMMRLMAPGLIPLDDETPVPASITAPFPEEAGANRLTRFDRAYLSALYSMRPNAPAPRLAERVAAAYDGSE